MQLQASGKVTHEIKIDPDTLKRGGLIFLGVNLILVIVAALIKLKLRE